MMSTSHFGWPGRYILRVSYGCYSGFSAIPHQEKHSNCTLFLIEVLKCDKRTEEVPVHGCAMSPEFWFPAGVLLLGCIFSGRDNVDLW